MLSCLLSESGDSSLDLLTCSRGVREPETKLLCCIVLATCLSHAWAEASF